MGNPLNICTDAQTYDSDEVCARCGKPFEFDDDGYEGICQDCHDEEPACACPGFAEAGPCHCDYCAGGGL